MKKAINSLALKIVSVILICLMSVLCVASVAVTVFLAARGAYTTTKSQFYTDQSAYAFDLSDIDKIKDYYRAFVNGDSDTVEHYKDVFDKDSTNLFFSAESKNYPVLSSYYEKEYVYSHEFYTDCNIATDPPVEEFLSFKTASERWSYIKQCEKDYKVVDYETDDEDVDGDGVYECTLNITYEKRQEIPLKITAYLRKNLSVNDDYARKISQMDLLYSKRYAAVVIAALSFLLAVAAYVYLLCAAGHKRGVEGINLNWIDKIPFDMYVTAIGCGVFYVVLSVFSMQGDMTVGFLAAAIPLALAFTSVSATFAARAKAGGWWRNTVIFRLLVLLKLIFLSIFKAIKRVVKNMPFIWIGITVLAALTFTEYLGLLSCYYVDEVFVLWVIYKLLTLPLFVYLMANLSTLERGGRRIAEGDTDYKINTAGMIIPSLKAHGECLNSIGEGMNKAFAEKLKSERMKTELITNVSHDIKTPLTSIVNYADLLRGAENEEQRNEYIEVIERHSLRLRKLIDDLVEASKASTGNMRVDRETTDLKLLLSQSAGEYTERLVAAGLEAVYNCEGDECIAMIDGRLMWRVFDNLYGNACKYAQKGTRLYVSCNAQDDQIKIIFKNVSATPLNVTGDELMERFVRGDQSRNSEGSGLGLSIAESLVKLQSGNFEIQVDGDLFKAVITLPRHRL